MRSWKEKWASINSKFETCTSECVTNYRSDNKCKDSLENVIADIWSFKDWLIQDPAANVSKSEIHKFFDKGGKALHISTCGDLATVQKHSHANSPQREDTELIWVGIHDDPSGFPIIYKVRRKYKDNPGNEDITEDAWELVRRAIEGWEIFLKERDLL